MSHSNLDRSLLEPPHFLRGETSGNPVAGNNFMAGVVVLLVLMELVLVLVLILVLVTGANASDGEKGGL